MHDTEDRRTLPSLTALRAFEAIGRLGSVRAAGDELNISHTVVSRHLRHLQDTLCIALVRKDGRGLALTEPGASYHAEIANAFALLRRATGEIRSRDKPRLRVWCIPGLVNRLLLPRLPELVMTLRQWEIEFQPTLAFPDLGAGEADAVIVYGDVPTSSGLIATERLVQPRVFPVASPTFLDRHTDLVNLKILAGSALLHEESSGQWESWFRLAGLECIRPLRGQRLWHAHLAIDAARLGQGVALANELLVAEDLQAGTLLEPFPSTVRMGWYQLAVLAGRRNETALNVLRQWLVDVLQVGPAHRR